MKKKIFSLLLATLLIITVLFGLTACGDEDGEKSSKKKSDVDVSSAEATIEAFVNAVNDQDASAVMDLMNFDALESAYGNDINKKDFKSGMKDFFEENEDLEVKVSKIKHLENDKDILEDLLSYYDSYEEYIEYLEDEYDFYGITVYTAKVELPDNYEDAIDDYTYDGRDVIYLIEDDGEFKIVYTRLAVGLYYDFDSDSNYYDYDDDDYDYDEDDDDDDEFEYEINQEAIDYFKKYEGKQTGKVVEEIADYIVDNTKNDYVLYLTYYGKDGTAEDYWINTKSDMKKFKDKLDSSHNYKVEVNPSDYGFCNVYITY